MFQFIKLSMSEKAISAEVFKLVVVVSSNSLEAGFLPNASSIRDLTINS